MKHILLFLLVVYISLLYESLVFAITHPQLESTYPLVIRIWCEEKVVKFVHTQRGFSGVIVTLHDHGKMDTKVVKALSEAVRVGFSYDMKDCGL